MTAIAPGARATSRKVHAYVDAVRGRDAIARAIAEDGATPGRRVAFLDAKLTVLRIRNTLTGGQLAAAARILKGGA